MSFFVHKLTLIQLHRCIHTYVVLIHLSVKYFYVNMSILGMRYTLYKIHHRNNFVKFKFHIINLEKKEKKIFVKISSYHNKYMQVALFLDNNFITILTFQFLWQPNSVSIISKYTPRYFSSLTNQGLSFYTKEIKAIWIYLSISNISNILQNLSKTTLWISPVFLLLIITIKEF